MSFDALAYQRKVLSPVDRFVLAAEEAPQDLTSAYAELAASCARRAGWAGWKLGGSNHATCAAYGVEEPYFGPLDASEIVSLPTKAPGLPLCELKGEVEIALRIDSSGQNYDAWCVALEMPASGIINLPQAGVAALVADRCAAGALALGPIRWGQLPNLAMSRFELRINGEARSTAGLEALTATPDVLFDEFLKIAHRHHFSPAPSDWVSTGGITTCCEFLVGDRVEVLLDGISQIAFQASLVP